MEQCLILNLPLELILNIAKFIERDWLTQDLIDDIADDIEDGLPVNEAEYENLKQLLEENNEDGYYYPLRNLYATCSSFSYVSELEYICIESGEFYYNTASRNINEPLHDMHYNGNKSTEILGYGVYDNGKMIKENCMYTDTHYHYRQVDGIKYFEQENCKRWWENATIK